MGAEDPGPPEASGDDVLALAAQFMRLEQRRLELEQELSALPPDSDASGVIWDILDNTLTELGDLVVQLADTPSRGPREVCVKAEILGSLMLPALNDPSLVTLQALLLAIAVSREVTNLG